MTRVGRPRVVVLGVMSKHPVAGVVWQTMHYLAGFERLGYEAYYVEAGAHQPSSLLTEAESDDRSLCAARFLAGVMDRFGFADRWAFQALHSDGRCYGMSEERLRSLYGSAEAIINLHGSTLPRDEHTSGNRLVYLETDPVALQIELHDGVPETIEFLERHSAFFTFGENYGREECLLPISEQFHFKPTRQPVVLDFWEHFGNGPGPDFTTIGNWKQTWRRVEYRGETYHWSKHLEFRKFFRLPPESGASFELALSTRGFGAAEGRALRQNGWKVRDALSFSLDLDAYRAYIAGSLGEFTVAKDQNVRMRSGWFSDRSATYLAAGRPVITQETGFSSILPTGAGLLPFTTLDEAVSAVQAVTADFALHSRAARDIARECFDHAVVLGNLVAELGIRRPSQHERR